MKAMRTGVGVLGLAITIAVAWSVVVTCVQPSFDVSRFGQLGDAFGPLTSCFSISAFILALMGTREQAKSSEKSAAAAEMAAGALLNLAQSQRKIHEAAVASTQVSGLSTKVLALVVSRSAAISDREREKIDSELRLTERALARAIERLDSIPRAKAETQP